MKKIYSFILSIVIFYNAPAQFVTLPDPTFTAFLKSKYPTCFNSSNQFDTTCTSIVNEDSLDFHYIFTTFGFGDLVNIDGIKYFKKLRYLNMSSNFISSITNNLPDSLRYLDCSYNVLSTLGTTLPKYLDTLICIYQEFDADQKLSSLPPLPQSLLYLDCSRNKLDSLPALPPNLQYLNCAANGRKISPESNLKTLSKLPLLPASLKKLDISTNSIKKLGVLPPNLIYLDCSYNAIDSLPTLPNTLKYLNCQFNDTLYNTTYYGNYINRTGILKKLPHLSDSLQYLHCGSNSITQLHTLPNQLQYLNCSNNLIYCIPKLPVGLAELIYDYDKIHCLPNTCAALPNAIICNPINNINNCQAFPVLSGKIFYDYNNNNTQDVGEFVKANAKITLSNGAYTFTDNFGYYNIGADSIGEFNLSATAPQFFDAVPATRTFNIYNYDTIVNSNFALQANTIKDSLSITLTSVNWAARPGFSFPYLVSYQNAGTTTLPSTISLTFDPSKLDFQYTNNSEVVNNGNSLTLSLGNFSAGNSGNFIAYFNLKTTVPINDSLIARATINSNTVIGVDSNKVIVRGSFDPNDKQATPELSPTQVAAGNYINYTVRFQNTGTDTAFNVVITDTLSNLLQANSLQVITASHNCKTTVNGNKVSFEFLNILLPDSNINELKSHGFVSFKIKPINTVVVGTEIPNKAAIYFDYNSPIITNTAITKIKQFSVVPLKLLSFTASRQPNNNALLVWTTSNEMNLQNFELEQSYNGQRFSTIGVELAKGRQYNNYNKIVAISNEPIVYYRLKMIDRDGQFTYSNIVAVKRNTSPTPISILNNPANTTLTVFVQDNDLQNTVGRIINAQGSIVLTTLLHNNTQQIDISKLPNGNYVLQTLKGSSQFIILK